MPKTYLIPHNYTNNGRVLNLFPKKDVRLALFWLAPASVLIFNLPLSFNAKLFLEILLGFPPVIAILAGYARWFHYIIRFMKNRKIYYQIREGENHGYCYPGSKNAQKVAHTG